MMTGSDFTGEAQLGAPQTGRRNMHLGKRRISSSNMPLRQPGLKWRQCRQQPPGRLHSTPKLNVVEMVSNSRPSLLDRRRDRHFHDSGNIPESGAEGVSMKMPVRPAFGDSHDEQQTFYARARQFTAEGSRSKLLQDREEQVADHPADGPSTLENNQIR